MIEEWRDVVGYEGLYQVSSLGRVKSLERMSAYRPSSGSRKVGGRLLTVNHSKDGYPRVKLSKNGSAKYITIHRLVALAFIPKPAWATEVNHIDENKDNNTTENLEWCTHRYNSNYGTRTLRQSETNRKKRDDGFYSSRRIRGTSILDGTEIEFPSITEASKHGFHRQCIRKVLHGNQFHTGGYIWEEI